MHEHEVTGVEHLELRAHAELAHLRRHRAQHPGRVDHDVVAAGREVHRAAVERADLGPQLRDVHEPLAGSDHVRSGSVERERRVLAAQHEVAAHARGQVEHHVDVGGTHALDHLAVQLGVTRPLAGRGIAYVDVRDRRAGASRLDRGVGDLLRRDGHPIAAIGGGAGTGDGAGDEGFPLHESASVAITPRSRVDRH